MPTIYLASAAQTNADRKRGLPVGHRLTIMHSPNTERGETGRLSRECAWTDRLAVVPHV